MRKKVLTMNYVFGVLLILFTALYDIFDILPFKWSASTCFVILAFINFFYTKKNRPEKAKIALFMLLGMIFAMGGDVSINFIFVIGAAVFALGHIFYLITYCTIERIQKSDILLAFLLIAAYLCSLFATPVFDFKGLDAVVIIYCIIINTMTAKAIMNAYRKKTKANVIFACGSVLFLISDTMLVLNLFANTTNLTHILCHAIYFPGQWTLAFGMFHLGDSDAHD